MTLKKEAKKLSPGQLSALKRKGGKKAKENPLTRPNSVNIISKATR